MCKQTNWMRIVCNLKFKHHHSRTRRWRVLSFRASEIISTVYLRTSINWSFELCRWMQISKNLKRAWPVTNNWFFSIWTNFWQMSAKSLIAVLRHLTTSVIRGTTWKIKQNTFTLWVPSSICNVKVSNVFKKNVCYIQGCNGK